MDKISNAIIFALEYIDLAKAIIPTQLENERIMMMLDGRNIN